jgi:hypothetical protein
VLNVGDRDIEVLVNIIDLSRTYESGATKFTLAPGTGNGVRGWRRGRNALHVL